MLPEVVGTMNPWGGREGVPWFQRVMVSISSVDSIFETPATPQHLHYHQCMPTLHPTPHTPTHMRAVDVVEGRHGRHRAIYQHGVRPQCASCGHQPHRACPTHKHAALPRAWLLCGGVQ